MILFDTRDAELAGLTRTTPEARRLQAIARPLDIPPLEPVPEDHVLTRTFLPAERISGPLPGGAMSGLKPRPQMPKPPRGCHFATSMTG